MPTYEFRCPKGHEFERFYRTISTAPSEAACPECGAVGARQLSAVGFSFKGSGFYLTDYGKNAHRGEAPEKKSGETGDTKADITADKTADIKADKTADTTADTKADTKADKKADMKADRKADRKADKKADKKADSVKPKAEAPKSSKKESE